jgi:hypothetical protein
MTEWYVIRKNSNTIINCITTKENDPDKLLERFPQWPPNDYRLDSNPPLSMLEKYRYWNERP